MNLELEGLQKLISTGQLKLVDTFLTDRAFEEFCRKHGNEINMALIDPATRKWLTTEYGVSEITDSKIVPRAQKHALVIRECKCGRKIWKCLLQTSQALPTAALTHLEQCLKFTQIYLFRVLAPLVLDPGTLR